MSERLDDARRSQLAMAMPSLKERAKTLVELVESAAFLFAVRPLSLTEKASGILDSDSRVVLGDLVAYLEAISDWNQTTVEAAVRSFVDAQGLKLGKVAQPLRVALTGTTVSPGIFDILSVLGREESLARIRDQIEKSN